MSLFTSILKDIAEETIPKISAVPKRFNKPWFSDICKDAINERNSALERSKREPTEGNLNDYRVTRAKARRDVILSKKTSWRNYISKLNSQASVKSVWNRIRTIKGKESTNSIHDLSVNDRDVTSHRDIANALAAIFLIIRPLLLAQMLLHLYAVKLKRRILTFHLKTLMYTIGPSL